jgi:hypothetical protein
MLPNAGHKWRAYRTQAIVKTSVVSICRPTSKPQDLARPSSWVGDFYRFALALDQRLSTYGTKRPPGPFCVQFRAGTALGPFWPVVWPDCR